MEPNVHHRIHNSQPPVPIRSQINPVHALHPTSWRSILILSWHLHLGLPSGLLLQVSQPKPSPPPVRVTCPALILFYLVTRLIFGEEHRSLSYTLCSFIHSPVTLSLLGPNILLSTLLSYTLSLRSSLNVSNQFSYPLTTSGKIVVLFILIFIFFDKMEDKRFCTEG